METKVQIAIPYFACGPSQVTHWGQFPSAVYEEDENKMKISDSQGARYVDVTKAGAGIWIECADLMDVSDCDLYDHSYMMAVHSGQRAKQGHGTLW